MKHELKNIAPWFAPSKASVTITRTAGPVAAAAVATAFALALSGCSLADRQEQAVDPVESMQLELVDEGTDELVAECIVRLGEREIERFELSNVAIDELRVICVRSLDDGSSQTGRPDGRQDGSEGAGKTVLANQPFTNGDDIELDGLWAECENGMGASCDQLFEQSPIGSEYEQFGVSCGERDDVLNCSELDEPEIDDELVPQIYREWQQAQDSDGIDNGEDRETVDDPPATVPAGAETTEQPIATDRIDRVRAEAGSAVSVGGSAADRIDRVRAEASAARAEVATRDAALASTGFGTAWRVDDRSYSSPEVAGRTVSRLAYDHESHHPLARLDPVVAGLVNP